MNGPYPGDGSEANARIETLRSMARAAERQKRMVEDADRLVALTTRYREHMLEHGEKTPDDARLLLEIEKLARSVKDRMRGM